MAMFVSLYFPLTPVSSLGESSQPMWVVTLRKLVYESTVHMITESVSIGATQGLSEQVGPRKFFVLFCVCVLQVHLDNLLFISVHNSGVFGSCFVCFAHFEPYFPNHLKHNHLTTT